MKINLSKKKKIIIIAVLLVALGGSGGYLLWRVNQEKTVSPTDSDAACKAVCDRDSGGNIVKCSKQPDKDANGNCPESCKGYEDGCCEYHRKCTSVCGDGTCSSDETVAGCPQDCAKCGDNICSTTVETLASCPADCSVCGDGQCTGSETLASCPADCSVCGDNQCTGSETATTCASDCVCKAYTWSNKPSGTYTPTTVPSTVTVTNPNSSSTSTTGIIVKLNSTTISSCSTTSGTVTSTSVGAVCYTASVSSGKQVLSIKLLGDNSSTPEMELGTYTLSVTTPGGIGTCKESTSFVVAENAVPQTGIFDGTLGKVYLGIGFVFFGALTTQFPKFNYLFNTLGERRKIAFEENRKKREEERRNRFERRFK